ncbi:MAG TPA: S41 family peptidase [Chloroflexota bacterium]|nr:S41 family peptidase [Chloroflexota bacterium]
MSGRVALVRLAVCAALLVGCTTQEMAAMTGNRVGAPTPMPTPVAEKVELTAEQGVRLVLEAWAALVDHVDAPDEIQLLGAAWDGFTAALPAGQTRPPIPEIRGVNPEADLLRYRTAYLTAATQVAGGGQAQANLAYGAVRRMVESVGDCLTTFVDGNTVRQQQALMQSEVQLGGVGIRIKRRPNEGSQSAPPREPIVVWELLAGGGAGKAGIKPGDAIVMVDGKDVTQMSIDQIASTIRGPAGSQVKLTVEHPDGKRKDFSVKRAAINEPAFLTKSLTGPKGEAAYFRLLGFGQSVQYDLLQAMRSAEAKNPRGWIFDLRTNASGDYTTMYSVLSKIMKEGPFAYDQDAQGRRAALGPNGTFLPKQRPYAVLVSDSTSSAAEVFSAAVQHYKGGIVIGTKTAGCAGVSSRVDLSDGSLLNVTSRKVLAPGGVEINKVGVTPAELVEVTRKQLSEGKDPQLDRALERLGVR